MNAAYLRSCVQGRVLHVALDIDWAVQRSLKQQISAEAAFRRNREMQEGISVASAVAQESIRRFNKRANPLWVRISGRLTELRRAGSASQATPLCVAYAKQGDARGFD